MADVFISYKSERREAASRLANMLAANGYSVWWDRHLEVGGTFDKAIERELRAAKAVVVLWCSLSVDSEWVRCEADLARKLDKIIPLSIEEVEPPLQFRLLQMGRLDDAFAMSKLLDAVAGKVGRAPSKDDVRVHTLQSQWAQDGAVSIAQLPRTESIKQEREKPPIWNSASELAALDEIYARRAQRIEGGHRIIFGVAGSGKTVLLIARAKAIAADPAKRVLVLCFNKALAAYLRSALPQSNVTASHFHAWANDYCNVRFDNDDEVLGEMVLSRILKQERYDAVLVDEGQDFAASWFKCVKAALRTPDAGDLLIAYDGAQSLFERRKFTWVSVGINARGRSYSKNLNLHLNYRNTREILQAAEPFCHPRDGDEEGEGNGLRVDPDCAARLGPRPVMISGSSRVEECKLVQEWIRRLVGQGVAPEEIAVLFPRVTQAYERVFYRMKETLRQIGGLLHIEAGADYDIAAKGIRLLNCNQAKGLQFPHVFLMWTDLFGGYANDRQLLYVGLTRAEQSLTISYKRPAVNAQTLAELQPHCQ